MSEIKEELDSFKEKKATAQIGKKELIFIVFALFLGLYIGNLLYGTNNLIQLLNLRNAREILKQKAYVLNHKNAKIKKKFFELELIKGETKK